ncbi:hypothetical protein C8F04DRAFT_1397921 [Mycena alexandri]|uniref:Uncharacterized protein n=1 Tax=Mycena alexandri TaxID=1745969 RepID=A0AAD6SR04_9AGAR|nr:hypothetical protein C8F04DRAFT_1397921 [Mycena alexandri]
MGMDHRIHERTSKRYSSTGSVGARYALCPCTPRPCLCLRTCTRIAPRIHTTTRQEDAWRGHAAARAYISPQLRTGSRLLFRTPHPAPALTPRIRTHAFAPPGRSFISAPYVCSASRTAMDLTRAHTSHPHDHNARALASRPPPWAHLLLIHLHPHRARHAPAPFHSPPHTTSFSPVRAFRLTPSVSGTRHEQARAGKGGPQVGECDVVGRVPGAEPSRVWMQGGDGRGAPPGVNLHGMGDSSKENASNPNPEAYVAARDVVDASACTSESGGSSI